VEEDKTVVVVVEQEDCVHLLVLALVEEVPMKVNYL
jgi:hypothetical protein|tara:strand:+ start:22 stop:129 length:108 start_codon:yes stop_codon:yes gene_type:complete